jgi:glutathione S-transferase
MSMLAALAKITAYAGVPFLLEKYLLSGAVSSIGLSGGSTLVLPRAFGWVILSNLVGCSLTTYYLGFGFVGAARKKYGIKYPTMHAVSSKEGDDAHMFNCAQRVHGNALESLPALLALSIAGGLKHPVACACAGLLWCVARVQWANGYISGDPTRRYESKWAMHVWTSIMILLGASCSTAVSLLAGSSF